MKVNYLSIFCFQNLFVSDKCDLCSARDCNCLDKVYENYSRKQNPKPLIQSCIPVFFNNPILFQCVLLRHFSILTSKQKEKCILELSLFYYLLISSHNILY